ncbi:Txe/YoeB family addiction module toxin [Mycobacterium sp.]|uniref:Txe/YoeB family addiction module toxin n=1 Tax=Mycobacterium sp. TaxID=1785 RepID=UPI003D150212
MRRINFDPDAWEDFLFRLSSDRKMARRITRLIGEIQREPFTGIGKPEPLKGELSGYWSRRIDDEHRLVYRADDDELKILKARYHYGQASSPRARRIEPRTHVFLP